MSRVPFLATLLALLSLSLTASAADEKEQPGKEKGGKQAEAKKPAALDPKAIFALLDANEDGKVSKAEFKSLAELLGEKLPLPPDGLDRVFAKLDADQDGVLSLKELEKFRESLPLGEDGLPDPAVAFKKLDRDGNGRLTKAEFGNAGEAVGIKLKERPLVLNVIFGKLDANRDGSLSLEEFKRVKELRERMKERKKESR